MHSTESPVSGAKQLGVLLLLFSIVNSGFTARLLKHGLGDCFLSTSVRSQPFVDGNVHSAVVTLKVLQISRRTPVSLPRKDPSVSKPNQGS